ncbi:MAG: hypothetical protein HUK23_00735 [Sphaerochaetaceae bacterium]|nr:hypothetical protein [Sphaerochaetaceae bacterium]
MHPKQEEFESKMTHLSQELDKYLEEKYGKLYTLHPNRMRHGTGANPSFDGLFSTSCAFTLGIGSNSGRGYVVQVGIRTLQNVSQSDKDMVIFEALNYINNTLPNVFPDRELKVIYENNLLKIIGDFSLGEL